MIVLIFIIEKKPVFIPAFFVSSLVKALLSLSAHTQNLSYFILNLMGAELLEIPF